MKNFEFELDAERIAESFMKSDSLDAWETDYDGEIRFYFYLFGETFTEVAPNTDEWKEDEDSGRFYDEYVRKENEDFMLLCGWISDAVYEHFKKWPIPIEEAIEYPEDLMKIERR